MTYYHRDRDNDLLTVTVGRDSDGQPAVHIATTPDGVNIPPDRVEELIAGIRDTARQAATKKQPAPATGLVVEPYRTDRGEHAWVFRCWGTTTCDGWLSLDHPSRQSAERARDRHTAEHHNDHQETTP